ncbi:MAG: metallophosphoesterase, partial [Actinobacteria bacterium]|nr:metallophosphoesterase [Actinomycetota bacterium]
LAQIEAVQDLVPDLDPELVVVSGDLSQRSRHGEYQAVRGFVRDLARTAPVYLLPGNHDVQWWWRPLIPFSSRIKYDKYVRYFGPVLAPVMTFPSAVVVGAVTSHGVAWGSLTWNVRDVAVKG